MFLPAVACRRQFLLFPSLPMVALYLHISRPFSASTGIKVSQTSLTRGFVSESLEIAKTLKKPCPCKTPLRGKPCAGVCIRKPCNYKNIREPCNCKSPFTVKTFLCFLLAICYSSIFSTKPFLLFRKEPDFGANGTVDHRLETLVLISTHNSPQEMSGD